MFKNTDCEFYHFCSSSALFVAYFCLFQLPPASILADFSFFLLHHSDFCCYYSANNLCVFSYFKIFMLLSAAFS